MRKLLLAFVPVLFLVACDQDMVSPGTAPSPAPSQAVAALDAASAAAGAPTVYTYWLSDVTETVPVMNPCFGPMFSTLTYSGVVHVTADAEFFHVVTQVHGQNVVTPLDPNQASYSGRFVEVQTQTLNRNSAVATFVVTSGGPNMRFHITFALVLGATGGAEVSVFNVACQG